MGRIRHTNTTIHNYIAVARPYLGISGSFSNFATHSPPSLSNTAHVGGKREEKGRLVLLLVVGHLLVLANSVVYVVAENGGGAGIFRTR